MRPVRVALCALVCLMAALASAGAWVATQNRPAPSEETPAPTSPPPPPAAQVSVVIDPLPATREAAEAQLKPCLGQPARDVVKLFGLKETKWHWVDEPPGTVRGIVYYPSDRRSLRLFIAEGEPLFRQFNDRWEWDYEAFLGCKIGGIQYSSDDFWLDLGPAVPWQWRRP